MGRESTGREARESGQERDDWGEVDINDYDDMSITN